MQNLISTLNVIDVASPCTADWDAMTGDDRVRHCGQCELNVYNLSEMTEREALHLVNEREGRLCVQFLRRADGTMITRDCPVGLRALRRKAMRMWAKATALAGAVLVGGFFGRAAQTGEPLVIRPIALPLDVAQIKGKMCVATPDQPVALTADNLEKMPAQLLKSYLVKCLEKEEQASYGMPDPDDKTPLDESVRQKLQAQVDDKKFLPLPGSKAHAELASQVSELLTKHPDVVSHLVVPVPEILHAIRGQVIVRPIVDDPIELRD